MDRLTRPATWKPYTCQLTATDVAVGMTQATLRGIKLKGTEVQFACNNADQAIARAMGHVAGVEK